MLAGVKHSDETRSRPLPSLFDRLAAADNGQVFRVADRKAAIQSVLRNLRINLNGRAGGAPARPDWGLSDFSDLAMRTAQAAPRLAREIKRQIEQFEPRLRHVRVKHEPDRELFMTACFHIQAELVYADERTSLAFETRVHANGAVQIQ